MPHVSGFRPSSADVSTVPTQGGIAEGFFLGCLLSSGGGKFPVVQIDGGLLFRSVRPFQPVLFLVATETTALVTHMFAFHVVFISVRAAVGPTEQITERGGNEKPQVADSDKGQSCS